MKNAELDPIGQILAIEDAEMRALQWRQSGFELFDDPHARLICGDGDNAAINRAMIVGR